MREGVKKKKGRIPEGNIREAWARGMQIKINRKHHFPGLTR